MGLDEQDAEYLKKLTEKTIEKHDGTFPVHQLSPADLKKWEGINIQGHTLNTPSEDEKTLALYMIDADNQATKRFTVTKTVLFLLSRATAGICYGTTGKDGHQFKVILKWEKEERITPEEFDRRVGRHSFAKL